MGHTARTGDTGPVSSGEWLVTSVGVVASLAAAITGIASIYINRKRTPFELIRVNEQTMMLKRVRRPAVVILSEPLVLCHGEVPTLHRAGSIRHHVLRLDDYRLLDVTGVPVGEQIGFSYARLWFSRVHGPLRGRRCEALEAKMGKGKTESWSGPRL